MAQARRKKAHVCKPPDGWIDPANVGADLVAEILGINKREVSALRAKGKIPGNGKRGKYNLHECCLPYVAALRTSGTAEAAELLKVEQRKKLEIQNQRAAGELVKLDEIADVLNQGAAAFMHAWRAIPRRIASELHTAKSAAECRAIVEREADYAREQLAAPIRKFYVDSGQDLPPVLADTLNGKQAPAKKS